MSNENDSAASLTARIETLERQNGSLKLAVLAALVLAIAAFTIPLLPRSETLPGTVVAREFILTDGDGDKRGQWLVESNTEGPGPATDGGVQLRFFGTDQARLCSLGVGSNSGGSLQFGSSDGDHFTLYGFPNEMQMRSGPSDQPAVRLTSGLFSGGPFVDGPKTMQFLELYDDGGQKVFSTADYYGFDPSAINN